jgi:hypothetical protein
LKKIPRCPVCRAYLPTSRTIDAHWRAPVDGRSVWIYKLACEGCLSVLSVERDEIDAAGRAETRAPVLEIAGAVTARALDRLRSAAAGSLTELRTEVERLRTDPASRVLLRIPEVFPTARPAYGDRVRLTGHAMFLSADPMDGSHVEPAGLLELSSMAEIAADAGDLASATYDGLGKKFAAAISSDQIRSEERRVGKECKA